MQISLELEEKVINAVECYSAAVQRWELLQVYSVQERAHLMERLWNYRMQEKADDEGEGRLRRSVELPEEVESALAAYVDAQNALEDLKAAYDKAHAANIEVARLADEVVMDEVRLRSASNRHGFSDFVLAPKPTLKAGVASNFLN